MIWNHSNSWPVIKATSSIQRTKWILIEISETEIKKRGNFWKKKSPDETHLHWMVHHNQCYSISSSNESMHDESSEMFVVINNISCEFYFLFQLSVIYPMTIKVFLKYIHTLQDIKSRKKANGFKQHTNRYMSKFRIITYIHTWKFVCVCVNVYVPNDETLRSDVSCLTVLL